MSKHYVLAVLVIDDELEPDADDMGFDPDATAERILDALCQLRIENMAGYTLLAQTDATPASENWAECEQVLTDMSCNQLTRVRVDERSDPL